MTKTAEKVQLDHGRFDAVIFDMDGVITDTARTHLAAWRATFDELLAASGGGERRPFTDEDYRRHIDGRSRLDGTEAFLRSRGIELPRGAPDDPPGFATCWSVANLKNTHFRRALDTEGAHPFESSLALVEQVRRAGLGTAIVTASRNRPEVLRVAGANHLFDVAVDGSTAADLDLPGKPDPALFLEAARQLEVDPARAVVVEDALSGVEAASRGGFGLVVGVARAGEPGEFLARGADVVVHDLAAVELARPRLEG